MANPMNRSSSAPSISRRAFLGTVGGYVAASSQTPPRTNVVMMIIDDCAADVLSIVGKGRAQTPNMKRLAERGVYFPNGYCAAPACGPSRAAMLTGLLPTTTGVYQNDQSFRDAQTWVAEVETLPERFQNEGYLTVGFGKVFHQGKQTEQNRHVWTDGYFSPLDTAADTALGRFVPEEKKVVGSAHTFYTWGPLPDDFDRDDPNRMQQDTAHADRAAALLRTGFSQPFFLTVGFWKPHVNWYVPQRYYDLYPPEEIAEPEGFRWDDLDDLPPAAQGFLQAPTFWNIHMRGKWKHALQAKYASITYVDEQIGKVLDALDESPHADNTIVVLVGDNGWHTGRSSGFPSSRCGS